jgi:Phosphotransferase enzyme family
MAGDLGEMMQAFGAWADDKRRTCVLRGVREAFGTTEVDEMAEAPEGSGADVAFRMVVRGAPYLLRVMTRVNEQMDPARIFACMNAAADAGIAPRVQYANAEDGVSISDYVAGVPLPASEALVLLPAVLRRLHELPRFPKTFNYVTAHNRFIWKLRKAALLPEDEVEDVFPRYEQVCAAYPRVEADLVSCHMDLKPRNIVYDGERVWLVGWQAAMVNDRYFDLAVAADFVLGGDADEWLLLEGYFGKRPDEVQRARFFVMRQVVRMLSASVYLMLGSRETGMEHWERLVESARGRRWDEAVGVVRGTGEGLLLPMLP